MSEGPATNEEETAAERGPPGCAWGCAAVLGLGLIPLLVGWDAAGTLCGFLIFVSLLLRGLRERSYGWVFSHRRLRQESNPVGFWSLAAVNLALVLASAWMLFEAVRNVSG